MVVPVSAGTDGGILEVVAEVRHYEWGLVGDEGLVGKLHAANSGKPLDRTKPYAEVLFVAVAFIVAVDGNTSQRPFKHQNQQRAQAAEG